MAQHGRRRRPSSGVLPAVLGWSVAAAAIVVIVLVVTGRPWGSALAVAVVGVVIVGGVTALVEVTGVLNRPAPAPPAPPTTTPDDGPPA